MYAQYVREKSDFLDILFKYIDDDGNTEEHYQNIIRYFEDQKTHENIHEIKIFLKLLKRISNYYNRPDSFFSKIEKLIMLFKNEISANLANDDIFYLFRSNKRILLFLLDENILKIDNTINQKINENDNYFYYFYPEIAQYNKSNLDIFISHENKKIIDYIDNNPVEFKNKRKIAENDSYICQLIRQDDIDNFISYVNKNDISLDSSIEESIFETNSYLMKRKTNKDEYLQPTLIEYSSFFGSSQIFKFLYKNQIKLSSSLIPYAIHGGHPEIIHKLEEEKLIDPSECFNLSIIFYQNDIANYFQNQIESGNPDESTFSLKAIKCCNFTYFSQHFNNLIFEYLCKYGYLELIDIIMKTSSMHFGFSLLFDLIDKNQTDIFSLLIKQKMKYINEASEKLIFKNIGLLCYAVYKEKIDIVRFLLTIEDIDVNLRCTTLKDENFDLTSKTALHIAFEKGNNEIVSLLLNNPLIDVNDKKIESLNFETTEYDNYDYYDKIYKKGMIKYKKSSLFIAIEENKEDIIKILLSNPKINVNDMSTCNCSYEYSYRKNRYHNSKKDLDCDDNVTENITALNKSIDINNIVIVKLLLSHKDIDVNIKSDQINNLNNLIQFIRELKNDSQCYLLKENIIEIDSDELLPLELAVYNKNDEIIKLLLSSHKIVLKKVDSFVLKYAVASGNFEIINILLSKQNFKKANKLENQLQIAIDNDKIDVFNYLLNFPKININSNMNGYTPLKAAIKNMNMKAFNVLLNRPEIDINDNSGGQTALKTAIENNNMDAFKILLNKPEININDNSGGKTALKVAVEKENMKMIELLLNRQDIDINDNSGNETALKVAVKKLNFEIVKLLASHPKIKYDIETIFSDINKDKLNIIRFLINLK